MHYPIKDYGQLSPINVSIFLTGNDSTFKCVVGLIAYVACSSTRVSTKQALKDCLFNLTLRVIIINKNSSSSSHLCTRARARVCVCVCVYVCVCVCLNELIEKEVCTKKKKKNIAVSFEASSGNIDCPADNQPIAATVFQADNWLSKQRA